ncbi:MULTISPECIES: DUF4176 domain-containing protein [unclassified Bacillus cereus group]|uniref:DUF4176 domain-containing protein n=1 Tax=unclassified Bacillus cereus group TaxID=2750818 RepID=UPI003397EDD9
MGIQLYNSIKEYYDSYWFLDLGGNYLGYDFELNPVIPGIELHDFYVPLQGYQGANDNQLNNIPIGNVSTEYNMFFNHEYISEVIFTGYINEDEIKLCEELK